MAITKQNILFFLVVGLVFLFVFLVFSSEQSYLPYDNDNTNYANYEGFEGVLGSAEPSSHPSSSQHTSGSVNESGSGSSNFVPLVESPKTVKYGEVRDAEMFDKIGQHPKNGVDGVDGCVSSGLSNSGGPICLSPEMLQLLKSRGGNATGN
jgi:hypothetical protein